MAEPSQLALLCALTSFFYLYDNIGRHPLLERPRISEVLIFLISGLVTLAASFVSRWLPGANGRFDKDIAYSKLGEPEQAGHLRRPRKYFWPLLLVLVVLRLELSRWLQYRLICNKPGVECLLPVLLAVYDSSTTRRRRPDDDHGDDDYDAMGNDAFEDIVLWFMNSRITQLTGVSLLSWGAFSLLQPSMQLTAFCPLSENRTTILSLQYVGVFLDAAILILAWRILTSSRTTTKRLRSLSAILVSSSVLIALVVLVPSLISYRLRGYFHFAEMYGVDSLYFFDVFNDAMVFSFLFISFSLFTCQASPLASTGIVTFLCGTQATYRKLSLLGTYEQLSRSSIVLPIYALCFGFAIFIFRNQVRIIFPRAFISFLLLAAMIGISIYCLLANNVLDRHPLDTLIYQSRTSADRWVVQASTSQSVRVAVDEYRERHAGRSPPPGFDIWFDFAKARGSVVLDHFQQIEEDILPFWGLSPSKIREGITQLGTNRDIGLVSIRKGAVTHQPAIESSKDAMMDDLVALIQPFAPHLQDMDLPINLLDRPRILATWSDRNRFRKGATVKNLLAPGFAKREADQASPAEDEAAQESDKDAHSLQNKLKDRQFATAWEHQRNLGQACPPGALSRSGFYSNNRDFCSKCVSPQAKGQFLADWNVAQDLCHQPDMFNLHGFYMSELPLKPFGELVPMFSRSKTDRFSDILIPLSRGDDTYSTDSKEKPLVNKDARLFWRGDIGTDFGMVPPRLLSGGHQERLSHLANNASASDRVTVCLAMPGDKEKFRYERVPLNELSSALKLDAGISDYSTCLSPECAAAKIEFGFKPEDKEDKEKMNSRYIMVMDSDEGPPQDFLKILRSESVPFVASVFKEWYSERLMPWLHFVPVDLRFHAVHSTLAYFTGLQDKALINGRKVAMESRVDNAKWIAQEGKKWAGKVVRREDAEIYLFRLLLEWGRVINDKRDEMGFELAKNTAKAAGR
ncbi:hypothetical protein N8I77_011714 [Diaporthe amygdali]|uniref:Glycosyl transferase CAP10 domain-containing protein n=1 Tax=Phomopsis amygdali TaxID=1214568 RepID=A0AAD9VZY8_PHOAM|nr:hypothetical protein N8I77_011714 [Diaporthe amygdali]